MSKWVAKRDDGNHGHDEGRHRWGMPKDATSLGGLGDPVIPGNVIHNYGKSPFLMGKSTINHHFQ